MLEHSLESVTASLKRKNIFLTKDSMGIRIIDASKANSAIGIKTLGMFDYLNKIHNYRRVRS